MLFALPNLDALQAKGGWPYAMQQTNEHDDRMLAF